MLTLRGRVSILALAGQQTDRQRREDWDRYWNAIVGNGGAESAADHAARAHRRACAGGSEAKRAFEAMMSMTKIDVATIEKARRG
jgi:predicted 3-demethylubiquinone-9 3-methyltransferase (glyoxalase superfamily)